MQFVELMCAHDESHPVLVAGAGLSYELVPLPAKLLKDLIANRAAIERELGVSTSTLLKGLDARELYEWAGEAVKKLSDAHVPNPKLAIAKALGVTIDPAWRGKDDVPLFGLAARHRVIARFAREGKWAAIWSLNWDAWLECALEGVGLAARPAAPLPPRKFPWLEFHWSWTHPEPTPGECNRSLVIAKPHGCVRKLLAGSSDTFLITKEELETIELNPVSAFVRAHFMNRPLVGCGWSASEKYLVDLLASIQVHGVLGTHDADSTLHFIDPVLRPGHETLIALYGAKPASSRTPIGLPGTPTADELFLWLQSRFGIEKLAQIHNPSAPRIRAISPALPVPLEARWINDFFDYFLPNWTLLCFRCGFVRVIVNAAEVNVRAIAPDRPDEYVPHSFQEALRPDLVAAARLLAAVGRKSQQWDFRTHPGAIWDVSTRTVTIPVLNKASSDLSWLAYSSMTAKHRWLSRGQVENVRILVLNAEEDLPVDQNNLAFCKSVISKCAHGFGWTNEAQYDVCTLDDL